MVMKGPLFVVLALLLALPALAGTIEGVVRTTVATADLSDFVISVEDIEGLFSTPEEPAVVNQKELLFVPHVLVIPMGTTVEFPNSDPVSHNVFSISETKRFNFGLYPRGVKRSMNFNQPGVVVLLCNVHLGMSAYIVVVKNPYFARTGSNGAFRIHNVPAGRHRVRCWHERFLVEERVVEVPERGSLTLDILMKRQTNAPANTAELLGTVQQ